MSGMRGLYVLCVIGDGNRLVNCQEFTLRVYKINLSNLSDITT
jgi:thiamine pyrophosphate-dependent acetolactate synthase large subunit-like protein